MLPAYLYPSREDSWVYWFGDDRVSWQLTKDDSMAQARMMLSMPREEAERSRERPSGAIPRRGRTGGYFPRPRPPRRPIEDRKSVV